MDSLSLDSLSLDSLSLDLPSPGVSLRSLRYKESTLEFRIKSTSKSGFKLNQGFEAVLNQHLYTAVAVSHKRCTEDEWIRCMDMGMTEVIPSEQTGKCWMQRYGYIDYLVKLAYWSIRDFEATKFDRPFS